MTHLDCSEEVQEQVQETFFVPGDMQLLHSLCDKLIEDWLQHCVHVLELCHCVKEEVEQFQSQLSLLQGTSCALHHLLWTEPLLSHLMYTGV